jgi:bzd-type benzoyl-CoA reductase Q subunit
MSQEFWRWKEYNWQAPDLVWQQAATVTAGVDVGSVSTQAVVMVDGELFAYANRRTGSSSPDSARRAMDWALEDTGLVIDDIQYVIGTGYGRVNVPFAHKTTTEITCHARGANLLYGPAVRTVLDMGGQDCKAIKIDAQGRVVNFLMNDKCAAGTGRGLEVIADLLQVPIEEMGELSLQVENEPEPVSSMCVVFAKTEALGLLRKGWKKNDVLAAYSRAGTPGCRVAQTHRNRKRVCNHRWHREKRWHRHAVGKRIGHYRAQTEFRYADRGRGGCSIDRPRENDERCKIR